MKIETTKRMIEVEENTYIAEDGTKFETKDECIKYEGELAKQGLEEKIEKLELKSLADTYPLDVDASYINECHSFAWYRVNNKNEFNLVKEYYNLKNSDPKEYPEIVCIEYDDTYPSDAWCMHLSDMMLGTIQFWKKHGYNVEFSKSQSV